MNRNELILDTCRGYSLVARKIEGKDPCVIFLGGFRSDMEGTKAQYLSDWCEKNGRSFLRFDYSGHGVSGGRFEEGSVGQWTQDALDVIGEFCQGSCVLVGSSMGGWIMLRVALAIGTRVQGLLGIAAAPDFTRDLISRDLSADQQAQLAREGEIRLTSEYDPDGYILTQRFMEDGEACCLLDAPLELAVPVRLLQGCKDSEVPWQTVLRLSERLKATDVRVQLLKDGGHRLSRPEQLALMSDTLTELIHTVESVSAGTATV